MKTGQKQGFIVMDKICESAVKQGETALFRVLPDILTGKGVFLQGVIQMVKEKAFFSGRKNSSLCLDCKKCVGLCSWSHHLHPVEGWVAEETVVRIAAGTTTGYRVISCPEFEREPERDVRIESRRYEYFKNLIAGGGKDGKENV